MQGWFNSALLIKWALKLANSLTIVNLIVRLKGVWVGREMWTTDEVWPRLYNINVTTLLISVTFQSNISMVYYHEVYSMTWFEVFIKILNWYCWETFSVPFDQKLKTYCFKTKTRERKKSNSSKETLFSYKILKKCQQKFAISTVFPRNKNCKCHSNYVTVCTEVKC